MSTSWTAAVAVIVAGGSWWLSDRPDSRTLAKRGQALAENCASRHGINAEGKARFAARLIHQIYRPGQVGEMALISCS